MAANGQRYCPACDASGAERFLQLHDRGGDEMAWAVYGCPVGHRYDRAYHGSWEVTWQRISDEAPQTALPGLESPFHPQEVRS